MLIVIGPTSPSLDSTDIRKLNPGRNLVHWV